MLSDTDIETRVGSRAILIEGFRRDHLSPASYDLTLSPIVRRVPTYDQTPIDVACVQPGYTEEVDMRGNHDGGYHLSPGSFILAATNEVVGLPLNLAARVEGKSSLGRLGLAVHITAGFIDPGFCGSITLEISNLLGRPIILRPGMRIAQIAFHVMHTMPSASYAIKGHYQNQPAGEPVESRFRMPARAEEESWASQPTS